MNQMAQGMQAINQNLANQANFGVVGNVQDGQLPAKPQDPLIGSVVLIHPPPIPPQLIPQAVPGHVQNPKGGVYTLEKFIKNGAKIFKGTTNPEQVEAWTQYA